MRISHATTTRVCIRQTHANLAYRYPCVPGYVNRGERPATPQRKIPPLAHIRLSFSQNLTHTVTRLYNPYPLGPYPSDSNNWSWQGRHKYVTEIMTSPNQYLSQCSKRLYYLYQRNNSNNNSQRCLFFP